MPAPRVGEAGLPRARRGRRLRAALGRAEPVLRLDEPDPAAAWDERVAVLEALGGGAHRAAVRRDRAARAGTELRSACCRPRAGTPGDFTTRDGLRHLPNLPTEEVFTTPDPAPHGGARHLDEAARAEGRHDRPRPAGALRGRRGGRGRRRTRTAARSRAHVAIDEGAARLGELALVDRQGRIGPLGTVFYDTLLDENAVSHIALGFGFPFAVAEERSRPREPERDPHRLHDRLARARGHRRDARRRARAGPARRRLADLSRRVAAGRSRRSYDCGRWRRDRSGRRRRRARAAGRGLAEPSTPALYTHALRRDEGVLADGGPLVVDTGAPHGPLAERQVRRAREGVRGPHLVGQGQPAARGGALRRRCATRSPAYLGVARPLRRRRVRGRRPRRTGSRSASSPTTPTTRCSRARCSSRRPTRSSTGFEPEAVVLHAPGLEADPAADGTRSGTFIALHPSRHGGADRRHVLRGRDQEVDLHGDERPAAARGRVPDALLGERRR